MDGGADGVGQGDAADAGDDTHDAAASDDGLDESLAFVETDRGAFAVGAESEDVVDALVAHVVDVLGEPVEIEVATACGERSDLGDHEAVEIEHARMLVPA